MEKLNSIENLIKQKQFNSPSEEQSVIQQTMNLNQAAAYISLSKQTMYHHTSTRSIPHYKAGKRIYFKKAELDQWLTKNRIMSRDEIEQEATNYIIKHKRKF
ncbi:MAG: helix-turn-helix domain-containing protein [Bacteroidetes bacterium]|nr:helix-turn-helix domain-containing protein [Bacteroidota bacterium]